MPDFALSQFVLSPQSLLVEFHASLSYFPRSVLVFALKLLALGVHDVRILPGTAAGPVGPAALGLGSRLRADI